MQIKRLCAQDAGDYYAIRLEALNMNPEAFAVSYLEEKGQLAEKYLKRFRNDDSFTFGAFDDDGLIGTVTLIPEKLVKLNHRASIVAMYVKPEKRGNGVAKQLIKEAITTARTIKGIEQIHLAVVSSNKAANSLYASFGFETYGIEKNALKIDGTYFDEELMVYF
ncbi:GNAT family N-acetyltransferase [Sporosarcina thermotolerans]|uniref:GNAT family N-acetyltransferase n=1 Tax=Sporosarcina thermotolerans TaxID=633404 RepID=UPI0024BC1CE5|nr:GNAT family N-acetyltransferase [Sporosarcina thermotolerans]WHT46847.1 GNAT family N-acetyltransferase [Sporosarcina thermotolerans]